MTFTRRAPGRLAGWVCLLATLLHAVALAAHIGRAAAAAPADPIAQAIAGALCTGGEALQHGFPAGGDEGPVPVLSACPVCTAGAALAVLPPPRGDVLPARLDVARPHAPRGSCEIVPAAGTDATPIRGPPPGPDLA